MTTVKRVDAEGILIAGSSGKNMAIIKRVGAEDILINVPQRMENGRH